MPVSGNKDAKGKGFDGNPKNINKKGAPSGKRVSTILKELLSKDLSEYGIDTKGENLDGNTALALEIITLTFHKDTSTRDKIAAFKEIMDRMEGKATQSVEVKEVKDQPLFPDV